MSIRCGYADTSLGQIHYRETGTGAPLLLLHPAPRSSRVFVPLLENLQGIRAIAVDLPGFGASCELPPKSTMASISYCMVEFLDAMAIGAAHVFGLHSGNKVAAALAAEFPERIRHLIIAGMRHSIVVDAGQRNEAMHRYVANKPALVREDDPELYDELMMDKLACRHAYDTLYQANYSFDLAAALVKVKAPTLILELAVAEEDFLGSPGMQLVSMMANANVSRFNCNDSVLLRERCTELAECLANFCNNMN